MPALDLSPAQATLLREVLNTVLSELGMEIASTDSHDYREGLKERRTLLREIATQLDPLTGTGGAPRSD